MPAPPANPRNSRGARGGQINARGYDFYEILSVLHIQNISILICDIESGDPKLFPKLLISRLLIDNPAPAQNGWCVGLSGQMEGKQ